MKTRLARSVAAATLIFSAILPAQSAPPPTPSGRVVSLFDGKTQTGWEGNASLWRVQDSALTGGSLTEMVRENDFLATTRNYTNFIVRMKIKLTGSEGFINSGFQIRSERVPGSSEMAGYQCDFGVPSWWGAIYDEMRRNKVISYSDMASLGPVIKRNDWNDYVIRADGPRITTWINGVQGTDYIETDLTLPDYGKLGIQVHGGGKALVQVKDITIEELPPTPANQKFIGAPEPKKAAKASPLSPEDQKASFTLPPGFEIELVASELEDIGKFVAVTWDLQGRMWSMTALEYPVDANESPEAADALYKSIARDKVLVWDTPFAAGPQTPRVFAEGLAIPLGVLPYKNGVYVQHGTEIAFLSDTNGDGKADKRDSILSGFGVQDSHLFPHQFTRAPGNWVWMAQGAFNYGKVKTTTGTEQQFDQTRMARFRHDGSEFDITSQGPCNIWGLVLNGEGEAFIQEANDYGFPMMPFHPYANYPGCSDAQFKSYAPEFPGTAPDFQMGGTGLSGLALSDPKGAWPEPYANVFYLANPITRKIQAIKTLPDGPRYRYQKLPDFVLSNDEMFRPVAIQMGPDGCLYIVDWYNKIISHNEVPRNHPERDKKRGRIWRVKHREQKPFPVPDFMKLSGEALLAKLGGDSVAQSHMAWQAITDRQMMELAPKLKATIKDSTQPAAKRIASLWALEGLQQVDVATVKPLLTDKNRNVRREGTRALGEASLPASEVVAALEPLANDPDTEVRSETIRSAGPLVGKEKRALALLLRFAQAPLAEPTAKSTHNGRTIKIREAYEREFERYLVRFFLERQPQAVAAFLQSDGQSLPAEGRLLAALALEPKQSAPLVAALLPKLQRAPGDEELLRLAQYLDGAEVMAALKTLLDDSDTRSATLESLLKVRTRIDAAKIAPLLADAAASLWKGNNAAQDLAIRAASAFKLKPLEPALLTTLREGSFSASRQAAVLRALREIGSEQPELYASIAKSTQDRTVRTEAINNLSAARDERSPILLIDLWSNLSVQQRRTALTGLSGNKAGATALLQAVQSGALSKSDLDGPTLDKLLAVLPGNPQATALAQELAAFFRPLLRLNGQNDAWVDSNITLEGPFTVETWIKLDPGIDNNDGILGAPGVVDMNFYDGQFRVWVGGISDVIVAKKKIAPSSWTHLAVSRNAQGKFKVFLNGELDNDQSGQTPQKFASLRVGWTAPSRGTEGWLTEFRVWNRERSADEIRADFDRSFAGETKPDGLVFLGTAGDWSGLQASARVEKTSDFPPLLTAADARAQAEKFGRFRSLAEKSGDSGHGKALFGTACLVCHSVGGQGGQIGPVLNGAGAMGTEGLLRAVLTPNAAMEAGYRTYRVELKDGDVIDGLLVSQNDEVIVLRRPNSEDQRIPQEKVRRAAHIPVSVMPEGLLEGLSEKEVSDLFAYLKTLK